MATENNMGFDLVTGGAGFMGSELVQQLVKLGRNVVVLDDLSTGNRKNIEGTNARLITGSVCDAELLASCLAGADRIFHLTCLGLRRSIHDPISSHEVNATGTLMLLQAAQKASVRRFIHVSSSEVYGNGLEVPMSESHPTLPTTPYGAAKLAGEAYARAAFETYGLPSTILRPFNSYGPRSHHEGDSGEVIPKFLLRAAAGQPLIIFGDGEQTRDFTFVGDTVRGIILAADSNLTIGKTINLGSGTARSVNELAKHVLVVTGSNSTILYEAPRPGDVSHQLADSRLAGRLLDWRAETSFINGLHATFQAMMTTEQSLDDRLNSEITHNWLGS